MRFLQAYAAGIDVKHEDLRANRLFKPHQQSYGTPKHQNISRYQSIQSKSVAQTDLTDISGALYRCCAD